MLVIWARLRAASGRRTGDAHHWVWNRDDPTLTSEATRDLLAEELLPAFQRAAHDAPSVHGVKHLLAQVVITTPETHPMRSTHFDFPLAELDQAKEKVSGFLLAQTPINLRKGSQIGFVVSNVAELALLGFRCERRTVLRTME